MQFFTKNTQETEKVGQRLAEYLDKSDKTHAFVAMRGDMGVGKTAFVRGFAAALGIMGVRSPTYTIVNEYVGKRNIFHFDMYRILDADDLMSIGFEEYLVRPGYCVVEWSENIEEFIPEDAISVTISRTKDGESARLIDIDIEEKI